MLLLGGIITTKVQKNSKVLYIYSKEVIYTPQQRGFQENSRGKNLKDCSVKYSLHRV